jgi:predicted DCC family thiol-disulfide oxidoreductase YuxK
MSDMEIKHPQQGAGATLYYDGECSLCMKEMARLGNLKNDALVLADIHDLPPDDSLPDKDTLLRTLHLRQADGRILTGVEANVAAWAYTRYGWCFSWVRWPVVRFFSEPVYRRWAQWRYNRLYSRSCVSRGEG